MLWYFSGNKMSYTILIHVNGVTGDDKLGDGTPNKPFKTVAEVFKRQELGRLPVDHTKIQAVDAVVPPHSRMPFTQKPNRAQRQKVKKPTKAMKKNIIKYETQHMVKMSIDKEGKMAMAPTAPVTTEKATK